MPKSEYIINGEISKIISDHSGIDLKKHKLDDNTDLYEVGMKSLASVQLMFALEAVFKIKFPDKMLKRTTFRSPATIRKAVQTLQGCSQP